MKSIAKDRVFGRLALLPLILFLLVFEAYPIIRTLEYSLFQQKIYSQNRTFVGIDNLINVVVNPEFWNALKNSLIFTFGSVAIQVIVGILIALLLNEAFFGRNFVRSLMMFSYIIPIIVAVIIWRFMLGDFTGIINYIITHWKLPIPAYWFSSKSSAMMGVIVVTVWKFFPFMVLMFLAQLQSIDQEQYEAAKIDGANVFHEFFFITLPFLKPVIFIAMMLRTIFTFKNFSLIKLLTGGGPLNATQTIPLEIYSKTFEEYSLGTGSAISFIMFIIILTLSFAYLKMYNSAQKELVGK